MNLADFVKKKSKFLSIADGETVTLIYKGFSIVPDTFNPGNETVSYLFQDPATGKNLPWNKSSSKVALQMNKIGTGETVKITRFGEGFETKYKIVQVGNNQSRIDSIDTTPF